MIANVSHADSSIAKGRHTVNGHVPFPARVFDSKKARLEENRSRVIEIMDRLPRRLFTSEEGRLADRDWFNSISFAIFHDGRSDATLRLSVYYIIEDNLKLAGKEFSKELEQEVLAELKKPILDEKAIKAIISRVNYMVAQSAVDDDAEAIRILSSDLQTHSAPKLVEYQASVLQVEPGMNVLEIGAGCGYLSAILAELATESGTIVASEVDRAVFEFGKRNTEEFGYTNIEWVYGDCINGCAQFAQFDRIIVSAASLGVPVALVDQLKIGGILVLPIGKRMENQPLYALRKSGESEIELAFALDCQVAFVPIVTDFSKIDLLELPKLRR